jgi:rod shape-determining protein MreC
MAILENRVKEYKKSRFKILNNIYFPLSTITSLITLLIAFGLVINSNFLALNSSFTDFKGTIYSKIITPTERFISNSIHMVVNISNFDRLHTENIILKIEKQKLTQKIEQTQSLKIENKKLKKFVNLIDAPQNNSLFAKIIYQSSSDSDYLAVIEGGKNTGINKNDIIISNGTLAGRIVTVGKNYSQVSLVNSYNSRIPVKTLNTGLKAILVGGADRGGYLVHLHGGQKPSEGELILTSGDGSYYPKDIPVARVRVVKEDNVVVEFLSDLSSTDFVEIINPNKFYN